MKTMQHKQMDGQSNLVGKTKKKKLKKEKKKQKGDAGGKKRRVGGAGRKPMAVYLKLLA
jgi:hypothetical protein